MLAAGSTCTMEAAETPWRIPLLGRGMASRSVAILHVTPLAAIRKFILKRMGEVGKLLINGTDIGIGLSIINVMSPPTTLTVDAPRVSIHRQLMSIYFGVQMECSTNRTRMVVYAESRKLRLRVNGYKSYIESASLEEDRRRSLLLMY